MSLKTIKDSFHSRHLNFRNIYRLITSDDFAIAYDISTSREQVEILQRIEVLDREWLRKFIKKQLLSLTPFHKMGMRRLREVGKNLCIPGYWNMNKSSLIEEIENVVERLKKNS